MLKKSNPPSPPLYKRLWCNSQTKLWSYIQLGGSGILASLGQINKAVSDPNIKEYLDKVDLPTSLVVAMAAIGVVSFLAHGHGEDA